MFRADFLTHRIHCDRHVVSLHGLGCGVRHPNFAMHRTNPNSDLHSHYRLLDYPEPPPLAVCRTGIRHLHRHGAHDRYWNDKRAIGGDPEGCSEGRRCAAGRCPAAARPNPGRFTDRTLRGPIRDGMDGRPLFYGGDQNVVRFGSQERAVRHPIILGAPDQTLFRTFPSRRFFLSDSVAAREI